VPSSARCGVTALLAAFACSPAAAAADAPAAAIDLASPQVQAQAHALARRPPVPPVRGHRVAVDHSGRKEIGDASVYAPHFQGRRMADGKRFDRRSHAAASKSLPLGTVAKVTNLENGATAVVRVEDRGPFVDGRTVDVTKSTAQQLGIGSREGVAPVIVAPIAVPQPDGSIKPGAGAVPGPATAK
jgi:rare lipoprotein A